MYMKSIFHLVIRCPTISCRICRCVTGSDEPGKSKKIKDKTHFSPFVDTQTPTSTYTYSRLKIHLRSRRYGK